MEALLGDIPGTTVYIDDILISQETETEHLKSLEEVLKRLCDVGLRVRKNKCKFMVPAVEFLGHLVDANGLHPLPDKVQAVQQAPTPQNVRELKAYLGLISYYGKFLPNLSTCLAPLYQLLRQDVQWEWAGEQEKAFQDSKNLLTSSSLLIHYNPDLPLVLSCDASAYGLGAVLAHRMPDGSDKPIGYASRTLNSAERNYSQLEKEGLSCIFGVKRFYSYLFGHSFKLITDHKPLLSLLNGQKAVSAQASARIRRWAVYLSMFEYTMEFRSTTAHASANALSRLPLPYEPAVARTPPELVLLTEHLLDSPVTADHIREGTHKDPQLAPVLQFVQQGWPNYCNDPKLSTFFEKRAELATHDGCLTWGTRVIIPTAYRQAVLAQLHEGHPGTTRMKGLARMYVWWPGITKDIESTVRQCHACEVHQSTPPVAPLNPWSWPTRPWARIHVDYAGPVEGRMILILIDAHTKWIEAIPTPNSTSSSVIEELRSLFARFGIPETLVSDNGTCFTSAEFETFLEWNGVRHITSAPYHPSSNGLAERAVQILKKGLKKVREGTLRTRIAQVLFAYRITPQSTTGLAPGELLLGRQPRSRLDLLKPFTAERVEQQQMKQKQQHDQHARSREFSCGDKVFVRNYHRGEKWIPGVIQQKTGPVSFSVTLEDGRTRRCHQEQVRLRSVECAEKPRDTSEFPIPPAIVHVPPQTAPPTVSSSQEQANATALEAEAQANANFPLPTPLSNTPSVEQKTYPKRVRNPVEIIRKVIHMWS